MIATHHCYLATNWWRFSASKIVIEFSLRLYCIINLSKTLTLLLIPSIIRVWLLNRGSYYNYSFLINFHSFKNLRLSKEQELFSTAIFGYFVWHDTACHRQILSCFHVRVQFFFYYTRRASSRKSSSSSRPSKRSSKQSEKKKEIKKWEWESFCFYDQGRMQLTKQSCSSEAL